MRISDTKYAGYFSNASIHSTVFAGYVHLYVGHVPIIMIIELLSDMLRIDINFIFLNFNPLTL